MKKLFTSLLIIALLPLYMPICASGTNSIEEVCEFTWRTNNSYEITDCNTNTKGELIIPNKYQGYPIKSIGTDAFAHCSELTNIVLNDNITSIYSSAFAGCTGLTDLIIPKNVTYMGKAAFIDCHNLITISLPYIGNYNQDMYNDTRETYIGYLFGGDYYGENENCIPESLKTVKITSANTIPAYSLYGCKSIQEITLPVYLMNIEEYAFANCESITNITLYKNITKIDYGAFQNCYSLNDIWYSGSESDKQNIQIAQTGNDVLLSAKWHYNTCDENNHIYSGECDTTCEACEWIRKPQEMYPHSYTNDCDNMCNICDFTRSVTHTYEWIVDQEPNCGEIGYKHQECSVCHVTLDNNTTIDTTGNHIYDNDCDQECNVCKLTRIITHNYQWIIDKQPNCGEVGYKHQECSVCHTTLNENTTIDIMGTHVYDTTNQTCSICGTAVNLPPQSHRLYGDVNGDKSVDAKDALTVLKTAVGKQELTDQQKITADVSGDSKINATDALYILQYSVGKRETFPVDA